MKETAKYVVTLFAFIAGAFILSWSAVYSFWLGAFLFRSVAAVRLGDSVGFAILFPARTLLRVAGDSVDRMTLLTNPILYAMINATLLGILGYACCRRWIFGRKGGG